MTFLWSSSFIIIKWGLVEIPPITFAGLRYILAFFCFIPFVIKKKYIFEIRQLKPVQWKKLIFLGLIFYTFTQGAQFLGLSLLPSVTVSLMLNFTPLIVGITMSGFPTISLKNWLFLIWLATINTAFAFTLWNLTLRSLTAIESSIINGTMLIQIAILAWYFLGESISFQEGIGMIVAATGVVLVQIKRKKIGNY